MTGTVSVLTPRPAAPTPPPAAAERAELTVTVGHARAAAELLELCADFLAVASPPARAELTRALRFDPACTGDPGEFRDRLTFTARYLRARLDLHTHHRAHPTAPEGRP